MPSTTTYRQGQAVVVNAPFSDQSGGKPRPALIVSVDGFHRALPDVMIGLRYPGTVRLSADDLDSVKTRLREAFGL